MDILPSILSFILDKYINKLKKEQVLITNNNNGFEMRNFSFKDDLFINFGIPLRITKSTIENALVNLNLLNLKKEKASLQINNIDIEAKVELSEFNDANKKSIYDLIQFIDDEQKKHKNIFNWFKWLENAIDNATINIENIRIKLIFQDYNHEPYSIIILLKSLKMDTIDSNGQITFLKKRPNILIKQVTISNFSIDMNLNISNDDQIQFNFLKEASFTFTMINNNRRETSFFDSFKIHFTSLLFNLNKDQFTIFKHFMNEFSINQDIHYHNLFLHFHRCAIRKRYPNQFNLSFMLQFLKNRKAFVSNYIRSMPKKTFIDIFMKKYGGELTYSLLFYTTFVIKNEPKINFFSLFKNIKLRKKELPSLPNDSINFQLDFAGDITLNVVDLFRLSIVKPSAVYVKKKNEHNFLFSIPSFFINDFLTDERIFHTKNANDTFIDFNYNSKSNSSTLNISDFKVNIKNSFLTNFCNFFYDSKIQSTKLKSQMNIIRVNTLNQYLLLLTPRFLNNLTVSSKSAKIDYIIDDNDPSGSHNFCCLINNVILQNFNETKTKNNYEIRSEINIKQIKIDDSIISKQISLKSTTGIIGENCIKWNLVSNFSISKSMFKIDSHIMDIINESIKSITSNFQIDYDSIYSSHKVLVNCSEMYFGIKLENDEILLSIDEIEVDPCLKLHNIAIKDDNQDLIFNIPCLCFNDWPIIRTDLMEVKLNPKDISKSYNQFMFISNHIKKLSSNFICNKISEENNEYASLSIKEIKCKFDDSNNWMLFNNVIFVFDENTHITSSSVYLSTPDNKQILLCENEIKISSEENNLILINVPDLRMNFSWNEIDYIINYIQNLCQSKDKQLVKEEDIPINDQINICFKINKSFINIDEMYNFSLDECSLGFKNSTFFFENQKISFDEILDINDFKFQTNNMTSNFNISSIDAFVSPDYLEKFKFFQIIEHKFANQQFQSQNEIDGSIEKIKIVELTTNLSLQIPTIKIECNSSCIIEIPLIQFHNLILNEIEIQFNLDKSISDTIIDIFINSIEFEYTHYFAMVSFNAYKAYQNILSQNDFNIKYITFANIDTIKLIENSLPNPIIISKLVLEKDSQKTEIKCNSIDFFKFIEKRNKKEKSFFFIIQKTDSDTKILINSIDMFVNIDITKSLIGIYESLKAIFSTDFKETFSNLVKNTIKFESHEIQIHLPYEKDLFKRNCLIISFDLLINVNYDVEKSINIDKLKIFFQNGKRNLPPLIDNFSFQFQLKNEDNEMEDVDYSFLNMKMSSVTLYLSLFDIKKLQMMFEYFKQSFYAAIYQKKISILSEKPTFNYSVSKYKIEIDPISICLWENNRQSSLIVMNIELQKEPYLQLLKQDQKVDLNLQLSILNKNLYNGKLEEFMPATTFNFVFTKQSKISFCMKIEEDLNFNFSSSFAKVIMMLIYKYTNDLFNKDTKYILDCNLEYYILNNLNDTITIRYNHDRVYPIENYNFRESLFPLINCNEDTTISFKYNNIQYSITPKNEVFEEISISIDYQNDCKTIVINPLLSIHNKLDFNIFIFVLNNNNLKLHCKLSPNHKYIVPSHKNKYFFSDTNINISDITHKLFDLSLKESPNVIEIYNNESKKYISFNLNINKNEQAKTKTFEIIPSFVVKNLLPSPINLIFHYENNIKSVNLQIIDKKQINFFNHDRKTFNITSSIFDEPLSFDITESKTIIPSSKDIAFKIKQSRKTKKRKIVIFAPCMLFNQTNKDIYFSFSKSTNLEMEKLINGGCKLLSWPSDNEKTLNIDILIDGYHKIEKGINCMKSNSKCNTILLPKLDNSNLFFPLNYTATIGDYPMNCTNVITFTNYLCVINNLPFDFALCPILNEMTNEINRQNAVSISHLKENNGNCKLIDYFPKNGCFVFSSDDYLNHPIVQLNYITRTVFRMKNKDHFFNVELNIYEEKSTFYACFQIPSLPPPLIINNSLMTPIFVSQKIEYDKTKTKIEPNSSLFFVFDEPFINNTMLCFEIDKNDHNQNNNNQNNHNENESIHNDHNENNNNQNDHNENNENNNIQNDHNEIENIQNDYDSFSFSFDEQFAPLEPRDLSFRIVTSTINKNTKMIQVEYRNNEFIYKNLFTTNLFIKAINVSFINEKERFALFTINQINSNFDQDNTNTYFKFIIHSIEIDKESINPNFPDDLFKCFSIIPRGIPFFSVMNYMSFQFKPILIRSDKLTLFQKLQLFYHDVLNHKLQYLDKGNLIHPSFNTVNPCKTLITYLEISPIDIFILNLENENDNNDNFIFYYCKKVYNYIKSENNHISIPKLFAYKFDNHFSYLLYLLHNFYGHEFTQQRSNNAFFKLLINFYFQFHEFHFVPLLTFDSNQNNVQNSCENQISLFNIFNKIELDNLLHSSSSNFSETSDVIEQLTNENANSLNVMKSKNFGNMFVAGIKKI